MHLIRVRFLPYQQHMWVVLANHLLWSGRAPSQTHNDHSSYENCTHTHTHFLLVYYRMQIITQAYHSPFCLPVFNLSGHNTKQQTQWSVCRGRGHRKMWNILWFTLCNINVLGPRINCLLQAKLSIYHYSAKASMSVSPSLYKSVLQGEGQVSALWKPPYFSLLSLSNISCTSKADINQKKNW